MSTQPRLRITREEWDRFHCAHHLSFAVPAADHC